MNLIIKSVISRVQRDHKVTICHFVWMPNHAHILIVVKDKKQCTRFYGEIQKQLTEAIKSLLGLSHLNLWKPNAASVVRYKDVETIMERIAYIYANPAQADFVQSIGSYPGLSSYSQFMMLNHTDPNAESMYSCKWIRLPSIYKLPRRAVSEIQDKQIYSRLSSSARTSHELVLQPNAWMKCLDIIDSRDVGEINHNIILRLDELESMAKLERNMKGAKVVGANKLRRAPVTLDYESEKDSKRIFVYSTDKEIRVRMIQDYLDFCDECEACYDEWRLGNLRIEWPPGALCPPLPELANHFVQ